MLVSIMYVYESERKGREQEDGERCIRKDGYVIHMFLIIWLNRSRL